MSRSKKKHPWVWISKSWTKFQQRAFRKKMKQICEEIKFDPDRDWEEAQMNFKKMGDYGTKCGFNVEPDPDDSWHDWYERIFRK